MFQSKKIRIAFNIMLILIGIFAMTQTGLATPFVLGGVILQGILGGFSGKVGPVVGAKWKSIDYMRGYVIPSNPNTAAQQAARLKFSNLVASARGLLASILQPFWDPFNSNMSGFNSWMSDNYSLASATGVIDETAVMSKGTLEKVPLVACVYTPGTGVIAANWSALITGNGLATDIVKAIGYDTVEKVFYFSGDSAIRNDTSMNLTIKVGLTPANVIFYAFTYRGTGSELVVSDSDSAVCT